MAQILIRNLNEDIKNQLKKRATNHGTSMEAEARSILANVLKHEKSTTGSLGTSMAARFSKTGLDFPLPELHGQTIWPIDFK